MTKLLQTNIPAKWHDEFIKHKNLILISFVFLAISLILDYLAGNYVSDVTASAVSDIIIDNTTPINLSFIFVYVYATTILLMFLYPLFKQINKFHVVISQFSLLILIRSFFISLTHLKIPSDAIIIKLPLIFNILFFQNDLFFSGHTAIPFLGFLLFRKEKIGIVFFIISIIMAITVLLMHIHYSIDVFAAFFITYATYHLGGWLFEKINKITFYR